MNAHAATTAPDDISSVVSDDTDTATQAPPRATLESIQAEGPRFRLAKPDGTLVITNPTPDSNPAYWWYKRADELAEWTMNRMVNRLDAFGHYRPLHLRKKGQDGKR